MGLEEEEQGSEGGRAGPERAGGHPQEATLFLELRFKETQDAKLSPSNCGRCGGSRCSLARSWEGWGRDVGAEGPAPHPGL